MKSYWLSVLLAATVPTTQGEFGTISGIVTDPSGAILPGVVLTLVDEARGVTRVETTNGDGAYRFLGLSPGSYSMTVELAGFSTYRHEQIPLRNGERKVLDVRMSIATVAETITVTGETPIVDVKMTAMASVVSSVQEFWIARPSAGFNTESYAHITDNPFRSALDHPLSTFSIDVDRASYSNTRRFLNAYELPPKDAVRIEELVNYFDYDYPEPEDDAPFSVSFEQMKCPWNKANRLVRVALRGQDIAPDERPAGNFVFLLDVSGSMDQGNKLPLVIQSMKMLTTRLTAADTVAIAVYAGASGLVLDATPGDRKAEILGALSRLEAGGSTNGGEGIELAYRLAEESFIDGGVNRVILATDGDFNVGVTSESELVRLIEEKAKKKVFLSVLGFGMGNYKDSMLEQLADKGDGNYAYIDTFREARKVLVHEMSGTLVTIAKDVKIQTELNPARVKAYRLIGYENRLLEDEDFNDDAKDAGEIGAGHRVTALYELVPSDAAQELLSIDELKYQRPVELSDAADSRELMTVKLRYKDPAGGRSKLLSFSLDERSRTRPSEDFKFASAVAAFGMLLRESPYRGSADWDQVEELAKAGLGPDAHGYRREFVELVGLAREVSESERLAIVR